MKVWITRHGQTDLNKKQLMQGVYDEPLNETGIAQAEETRKKIGDMKFDAVYCSKENSHDHRRCIRRGIDRGSAYHRGKLWKIRKKEL